MTAPIATALVQYLLSQPKLTALVDERITPRLADKREAYPQVVYEMRGLDTHNTFDGPGDMNHAKALFTIVDRTFESIDAIADAIIEALDGKSGNWNGVDVQGVFLDAGATQDGQYVDPQNETALYYTRTLTFTVAASVPEGEG